MDPADSVCTDVDKPPSVKPDRRHCWYQAAPALSGLSHLCPLYPVCRIWGCEDLGAGKQMGESQSAQRGKQGGSAGLRVPPGLQEKRRLEAEASAG